VIGLLGTHIMGQTLSNCIPQYPTQVSPVEEDIDVYDKKPSLSDHSTETGTEDTETRGLKLQKNKTATPIAVNTPISTEQTDTPTSPGVLSKKQISATKVFTEQDFFSDMKPKYAPPPMVNPKHVSRLTLEEDTDVEALSGWDITDENDRNPKTKEVRQKSKLDSTTTNESFDDFDD